MNGRGTCVGRAAALAMVLAASTAADAGAGDDPGVSLGGRGTYFRAEDADEGSWYGGAQLRLPMSKVFALEGSVDYRRERFRDTRVDIYPVQASLLGYLVPGSPVSPFILAGAGWYFTHVEGPGGYDSTQHRFGPHLGGGLQLFVNEYWSLDGTYRRVWVEAVRSRDTGNLFDKDYNDRGHMFTFGLNFHF